MSDQVAATSEQPLQQACIFVAGASRSGTTMLSRILGNADGVLALKELHFFGGLVPVEESATVQSRERAVDIVAMTLARDAGDFWVGKPTSGQWQDAEKIVDELPAEERSGDVLFAATMAAICAREGASRVCEQTPRNVFYARHLLEVYPAAQVVCVVRDPRAVLASQKNRHNLRKLGGSNVPVREILRLWVNYHPITMVRLWRAAIRAMTGLEDQQRLHVVRYEDVIEKPHETLAALCEKLGLQYDPAMINVPHWGSSTVTHTEKAGLSNASVDKWQSVLNGLEVAYCTSRTSAERKRFGYADGPQPRATIAEYLVFGLRLPLHVLGAILVNPGRVLIQAKAMLAGKRRGPGAS